MLRAAAEGMIAGLVCVAGLFAGDPFGLAALIWRDPAGYMALALLVASFAATFAAASFAGALWAGHSDQS